MDSQQVQDVVDRARQGDESAWTAMVAQYGPMLAWVARQCRVPADEVSDVVQITWLRCFENLENLRNPRGLASWLVTTCRRESMRTHRGSARTHPHDPNAVGSPIALLVDPQPEPAEQVAGADEVLRLYRSIDALPVRQRAVVVALMHARDDGYNGAARRLGMPIGSIGPTRRRALMRLSRVEALQVAG